MCMMPGMNAMNGMGAMNAMNGMNGMVQIFPVPMHNGVPNFQMGNFGPLPAPRMSARMDQMGDFSGGQGTLDLQYFNSTR